MSEGDGPAAWGGLVRAKRSAIERRWLEAMLSTYPAEGREFFGGVGDRFANPVGAVLRRGVAGVVGGLLGECDAKSVCGHLEEMLKVRAVQEFSPSEAVSFVFELKGAVRAELGSEGVDLSEMDRQVDRLALFAFDIYVRCRDRIAELRVDEVKRGVAGVLKRFHAGGRRGLER